MTDFISTIRRSIERHKLLSGDAVVIVALSGGADSVALLSALTALGYRCIAAHCNFKLRGEESERDQCHAADIARRLGAEFAVTDFNTTDHASAHGISIEMAARELRYRWFEEIRQQYSAEAIAVAHHRDDNIETFFLNLLRGTGIAGLTAMSPRRGYIIRPMLDTSRADVLDYLRSRNLNYVTDSTNADCDYKRNRLRNIVLPILRDQFPDADEAIAHTISCLQSNETIYQEAVAEAKRKYVNGSTISLTALIDKCPAASTMLFEMLRPYGFNASQAADMANSADNTGSRFISPTHTATINRGELLIRPIDSMEQPNEYIISLDHDIAKPIDIKITRFDNTTETRLLKTESNSILLDAAVLDGNPIFKLRKWQQGDRMAPFGMHGTKKISDIFSNARLSLHAKQSTWILTRNDEILWVVGLRASRHFSITDKTAKIIRLSVQRHCRL